MATDHTETLRLLLVAAGFSNVVAGDRWPDADEAVVILPAPGGPRRRFLDGGTAEDKQDGVQVIVRGSRNGYAAAHTRARAIYNALRFAAPDGYDYIVPQGGAGYIGRDGDERPQFSINFIARLVE